MGRVEEGEGGEEEGGREGGKERERERERGHAWHTMQECREYVRENVVSLLFTYFVSGHN